MTIYDRRFGKCALPGAVDRFAESSMVCRLAGLFLSSMENAFAVYHTFTQGSSSVWRAMCSSAGWCSSSRTVCMAAAAQAGVLHSGDK